jgi:thymidylate synthase
MNIISDVSVVKAWARAVVSLYSVPRGELSPLVVEVDLSDEAAPDVDLMKFIDDELSRLQQRSIATTANTIFPESMARGTRMELYRRYRRIMPTLRQHDPANRFGTYFGRMIAYGKNSKNQLEHVISTFNAGNHRRSALQMSIFNPEEDHSNTRQRGFPCVQHVFLNPYYDGHGMSITGVYARQHLVNRGLGNYVGLCRLGHFVARSTGRSLTKLICIANIASLSDFPKGAIRPLRDGLTQFLPGIAI